jgi:hypothetical protein
MAMNCSVLFLFYFTLIVASLPTNTTVVLPPGTDNHGNPNLLCTPTSWSDIAIFFLGNFVAHAATVHSFPGENLRSRVFNRVFALFMPGYGLFRGIAMISTFAAFGKTNLEVATRAGNLFMVVRTLNWQPNDGDCVKYAAVRQINQNVVQIPETGEHSLLLIRNSYSVKKTD